MAWSKGGQIGDAALGGDCGSRQQMERGRLMESGEAMAAVATDDDWRAGRWQIWLLVGGDGVTTGEAPLVLPLLSCAAG